MTPTKYKFKSLEDLNRSVDVDKSKFKDLPASRINERINLLLNKAKKETDQETAYTLYMRAVEVFSILKDRPNLDKELPGVKNQLVKNINDALKAAEQISNILRKEYNDMHAKSKIHAEKKQERDVPKIEKQLSSVSKPNGLIDHASLNNGAALPREISPKGLKNLIDQKATSFLLIDCRGKEDFYSSHVNYPDCISVPNEILEPGMSAQRIGEKIKLTCPASYHSWLKRGNYDKVILYDWNSSFEQQCQAIMSLYTALTKWDLETAYKHPPLIVTGGLRNLYYTYPTLIRNPQSCGDAMKSLENLEDASVPQKHLEKIQYPVYELNQPNEQNGRSSPSTTGRIIDARKPPNSQSPPVVNNSIPAPDRSLKPTTKVTSVDTKENSSMLDDSNDEELIQKLDVLLAETKALLEKEKSLYEYVRQSVGSDIKKPDLFQSIQERTRDIQNSQQKVTRLNKEFDNLYSSWKKSLIKTKPSLPKIRPTEIEQKIETQLEQKKAVDTNIEKCRENIKNLQEKSRSSRTSQLPSITPSNSNSSDTVNVKKSEPAPSLPMLNGQAKEAKPNQNSNNSMRPVSQDASISYQKLKDESTSSGSNRSSSLLKRSHSHPNITQASEDEGSVNTINTPEVNRNTKPASRPIELGPPTRARQFHAVNSTEKHLTGLKNLGNTCYMNSIMQCLNKLPAFVRYFCSDEWKTHCRRHGSSTNGEITLEIQAALQEMNIGHRSIALQDLKIVLGKHVEFCRGYGQQDSHEFLTKLFELLHEELNQAPNPKKHLPEQKNDGISEEEAANRFWKQHCEQNDSILSKYFHGCLKSTVKCLSCHRASITFEMFSVLSVPIPASNKKVDIMQCIDLYTTEEILPDRKCEYCNHREASKKIDLWKLPPYLIIHLQRFYNEEWTKKRLTEVEFPIEDLDLSRKIFKPSQDFRKRPIFMLQAVSNHYGTRDGGHYTAYCRNSNNKQWTKFEDHEVYAINSRDVVTPAAYILFYKSAHENL